VKAKLAKATWGGARKKAGRKPLGQQKRVHRSVTIDPDIYQCLASDAQTLQAQGLKVKISDVLNCRLREDYKRKPDSLFLKDLEWAKRERQKALKKLTAV